MHGCDTRAVLVVNAEVDSMGGVGSDTKTSPRRAAIEKVQDELRQEYDVLEERRRELEYLEKGGDPLEFKIGHAVSVSVQSTSLTDQQVDQFVTSEANGSFAFTASPHGDSVESSGRPGRTQLCEPNSADNLNLFDGENKFIEGEQTFRCLSRNNIAPLGQSTQMAGNPNVRELGDSAALGVPRKAYKRRYRTRPSRDGARSNSNDVLTRGGRGFSLPSFSVSNDSKGLTSDAEIHWDQNIIGQPISSNGGVTSKTLPSRNPGIVELDNLKAAEPMTEIVKVCQPNDVSNIIFSSDIINSQKDQNSVGVAQESPIEVAPKGPELSEKEKVWFGGLESQLPDKAKVDDKTSSRQLDGFISAKGDRKSISNDGQHSSAALATKALDSESSCTETSLRLDEKKDAEIFTDPRNIESTGNVNDQSFIPIRTSVLESDIVKDVKETKTDGICGFVSEECNSLQNDHQENGFRPEPMEELVINESTLQSEIKDEAVITCKESIGHAVSETDAKPSFPVSVNSNNQDYNECSDLPGSFDSSVPHPTKVAQPVGMSSVAHEGHQSEITINFLTRADEDSILEEALIIEAKRKRIAELSAVTTSVESRCKSHWDFVLEEMAWLANDFVQERLWKITAAAQMSYHAAFTSQLRFQEINNSWSQKKIAHTLAKAVMNFWHSVKGINKMAELQCPKNGFGLTIHEYAIKFLKGNNFDILESQAEAPATPERVSDTAIVNLSWEDNLTEENLFYTVPPGAAETFRKSIESQVLQCEKTRTNMQEEVDASACEAMAGSQDYAYEEDEGEATMYDMPVAFGGSSSSRFSQKKRKFHMHTYNGRSYDVATDLSFTRCMENKVGSQQSMPQPKRLTTSLNESFPTKRVRTCYRERVLSPFSAGISGLQVSTKTDASSETSSFQDDQSNLHGGSHVPNCVEVESVGNFEKHREFNSVEVSMKFKKKKKSKYPGSSYEQRWSVDSNFQNEQGDYSRTRLESHQFESNDCNGIFGQHIPKKPKIMRPSRENTFDNNSLIHGLTPPPSASQMSNVPHTNKFTRMLTGRDLSRKAKSLKMPSGQPGSGSQWSPFEDQALVVLVHDMGPNWELVSDAINSTLQFKSIYRKPKECKERHKILMVTNGDGADSAEDSGSSQPYPSTLPGIPKGSARQLFQRLLGPVEEATLKSHIEKIILIGRKYLFGNTQGDNQDPKQIQQPHSSHTHALSQVIPNNLNGRILTPLDLCDAPSSSLDIPSVGYQTPHSSGLAVSNQASLGPISPSGANSATIQDSLNLSHGNNFSSSSSPLNASVRDIKYAISRATSMPVDEQQRMHHCNQQLPGRNISISSTPGAFPGPDRGGVRVLPSGNGMGIISGTNRGISTPRPGFQGIASPSSMLNSGSMTSSGMIAMPIPVNMHSGVSSGQGNSMATPRDNLHMMRPIQHQEAQRQMMLVERQIQASQVNSQAVPSFGGLTTSYPNQTASSHVPPYPPHHQQAQSPHIRSPLQSHAQATNHTTNSQQKTYALHLAKERQLQQRLLQQKQKFGTSNSVMPSVHQHQLPVSVSSPLHNSPQITSQSLSPPVLPSTSSVASMPQNQLKHSTLPHGHSQSSQSGGSCPTNQLSKQQPFQQTSRSHPQLRQQNAKLLKGLARGNALNQNMQMDPSALNRTSSNSRTIATEKGDQMTNSMQNQGLYSGSAINSLRPAKSSSARDMQQPQQKLHSDQAASSTKPLKQASQSDNMSKGHSLPTASMSTPTAGHQSIPTPVISSSNHQPVPHSQPQVHTQKILVNQSQSTKKTVQPGCLMNSEPSNKLQASESQFNQHIVNTSSPIGTMMATASECNTSTNAASVISPDVSQWKAAEPLFDSIGSLPNTAAGSEHSSEVGRGLSQRLSSDSLSPAGHDASLQLEQPSQLQTHSPVHQPQQHQQ